MKIGEREIGAGHPAFCLAEVASAHQGEAVQALALATTAKDAGADASWIRVDTDPGRAAEHRVFRDIDIQVVVVGTRTANNRGKLSLVGRHGIDYGSDLGCLFVAHLVHGLLGQAVHPG